MCRLRGMNLSKLSLWACAVLFACQGVEGTVTGLGGAPSPQDAGAAGPARVLRLAASMATRIDAPGAVAEPVFDLAQLSQEAPQVLLTEDFGHLDPKRKGWGGVDVRDAGGGDLALMVSGLTELGAAVGWCIDVEPSTYYRFERRAFSRRAFYADFAVIEAGLAADDPGVRFGPPSETTGHSAALAVHWPEPLEADGEWHSSSVSFLTSPETRSLAILIRSRVNDDAPEVSSRVWFDDVQLERHDLDGEGRARFFAGHGIAQGAATAMDKAGRFLPHGAGRGAAGDALEAFEYRRVVFAPAPTRMAFQVDAALAGVLRLGLGLAQGSSADARARFRVLAHVADETHVLLEEDLAAAEAAQWHDRRIELSGLAGAFELELCTEALEGTPLPLFGTPVIEAGEAAAPLVLVIVDALRADRLSCQGYERDTTPALDALAAAGVRFAQAVAPANFSEAAVASLFTGLMPTRHGVLAHATATRLGAGPTAPRTLAEALSQAGYLTHMIAAEPELYDSGLERGFDRVANAPGASHAGEVLERALAWLEENAGRRAFLTLFLGDPGQPLAPPAPFAARFGDPSGIDLPLRVPRGDERVPPAFRQQVSDLYDGEVAYVDHAIGRFVAALEERGLYDAALISVVGDHGESLWDDRSFGHGGRALSDGVVHVPWIVKPPAGSLEAKDGDDPRVVEQARSTLDLMPTLLELVGAEVPPGLDGRSAWPLSSGPPDLDATVVVETAVEAIAVRSARFLFRLAWPQETLSHQLLYALESDPFTAIDFLDEDAPFQGELVRLRVLALDHLLQRNEGSSALALVRDTDPLFDIQIQGPRRVHSYLGQRGSGVGATNWIYRGPAVGRIAIVIRYEATEPVSVRGLPAAQGPEPYVAGRLAELLARPEAGLFLFE